MKILKKIDIKEFAYCVLVSLTDSLPDGKNPFETYDNDYYQFVNQAEKVKKKYSEILLLDEFLQMANDFQGKIDDDTVGLDTEFTITYTSGSTKVGWPKGIVHTNRSYISIGRFHDSDLSLMPKMRNMRGLAHIPTHSNTDLASSISDVLMQTCTVACEPIYNETFFARSLIINKPEFVPATRSFWIRAMKQFFVDEKLKNEKLDFIVNAVAVGEDVSRNEEKYINNCFKRLKAGRDKLPRILRPTTISVGGGDCEHGGLFFTLLKGTREKLMRRDYGLIPFQLADLAILRKDGTECNYDEMGILVANSPCTMKEYRNNVEATNIFFIRDAYGRIWGNCNVWACIDKKGRIHMRGRVGNEIKLENGYSLPMYKLSDVVLRNEKILSCETVINHKNNIISFVEPLPEAKVDKRVLVNEILTKIEQVYGAEISKIYSVQMVSNEKSFALTKSGKRNIALLEELE